MINRDLQKVIFQTIIQEIMKAQHRVMFIPFMSELHSCAILYEIIHITVDNK